MAKRIEYLQVLEEVIPTIEINVFSYNTSIPRTLVQESFCDIWLEYNAAIINNILGLRRHIIVLSAWRQVLDRFDDNDEARISIMIDFVEPTLFRARDIPGAVREQCHQCAGKMTYLLNSGDETLDEVHDSSDKKKSSHWRKYHVDHHQYCPEYDSFREKLRLLHKDESDNARHLQESHGKRHHDIATIVGTKRLVPMIWEESDGKGFGYVEDKVDLSNELEVLREQYERTQEAYEALDKYLNRLFHALIEQLQERGYDVKLV